MRPKANGERVLMLGAIMAILLSACIQPPQKGVQVKALAADLVFGVPPLPEPVAPPFVDTTPENPIGVVKFDPPPLPPIPPEPPACPKASVSAVADPPSSTVVIGQVLAGPYPWFVTGSQQVEGLGKQVLGVKHERRIVNVTSLAAEEGYQYTIRERDIGFGESRFVEVTYVIRPDMISLSQIVEETGDGRNSFNPTPEIDLLPLPAKGGTEIDSVGVDPQSLEAFGVKGVVQGKRKRVDACGELVDGWHVIAEQEFTSVTGDSYTAKWDYVIATQLGGLLTYEEVSAPRDDPVLKFNMHIGSLKPVVGG